MTVEDLRLVIKVGPRDWGPKRERELTFALVVVLFRPIVTSFITRPTAGEGRHHPRNAEARVRRKEVGRPEENSRAVSAKESPAAPSLPFAQTDLTDPPLTSPPTSHTLT